VSKSVSRTPWPICRNRSSRNISGPPILLSCWVRTRRHPPRILLLYGSLRPRSFSRLLVEEAARLLQAMGGETRIFNPSGLPLPDDAPDTHPKVQELRELAHWVRRHGLVLARASRRHDRHHENPDRLDPLAWAPCARPRARRWR
jgi:hypothetical protein